MNKRSIKVEFVEYDPADWWKDNGRKLHIKVKRDSDGKIRVVRDKE